MISGNKSSNRAAPPTFKEDNDVFNQILLQYGDDVARFVQKNPDNIFSKILALLSGFIFGNGEVNFPPADDEMKQLLSQVPSERKIDKFAVAQAYVDALCDPKKPGEAAEKIQTRYAGSNEAITMNLRKFVDDSGTGFKGAIYEDANGHFIVVYGGMDIGNGFNKNDLGALAQAGLNRHVNQQVGPAQELLKEALAMASARKNGSVEIIGNSLGAMLANDMAARFRMKVTNIADIGLPDVKDTHGKSMYTEEAGHFKNIRENVVTLKLPGDIYFGTAGKVRGEITELPSFARLSPAKIRETTGLSDHFNVQNEILSHCPQAFAAACQLRQEETQGPVANVSPGQNQGRPG